MSPSPATHAAFSIFLNFFLLENDLLRLLLFCRTKRKLCRQPVIRTWILQFIFVRILFWLPIWALESDNLWSKYFTFRFTLFFKYLFTKLMSNLIHLHLYGFCNGNGIIAGLGTIKVSVTNTLRILAPLSIWCEGYRFKPIGDKVSTDLRTIQTAHPPPLP